METNAFAKTFFSQALANPLFIFTGTCCATLVRKIMMSLSLSGLTPLNSKHDSIGIRWKRARRKLNGRTLYMQIFARHLPGQDLEMIWTQPSAKGRKRRELTDETKLRTPTETSLLRELVYSTYSDACSSERGMKEVHFSLFWATVLASKR